MVRYPDTLVVTWTGDGSFGTAGNYTAGSTVSKTIEGRAEANGKGNLIRTNDGAQIVYDYMFYSEKQDFQAPFGASADLNSGKWKGTVKHHVNSQVKTRIWL